MWLGRPAFLGSVAVLGVNDHVLKDRFPGWWTGKLSDVAGVAMVATVLAVVLGPRRGLAAAGAGFAVLKTVPGVAEAAAPLLGGVTARDAADLLALAVLVPVAVVLRSWSGRDPTAGDRPPPRRRWTDAIGRAVAGTSAALPAVGAVAALMTATATSCASAPAVTEVVARGDTVYALIDRGYGDGRWAASTDGGRSWEPSMPPEGHRVAPRSNAGTKVGATTGCADGDCYRVRHRRVIERSVNGGDWVEEFRLSDREFDHIAGACVGGDAGTLRSLVVADAPRDGTTSRTGRVTVASLGAGGVLVRDADGTWERARVLSVPPVPATGLERSLSRWSFLLAPVLAVALAVRGWRRWPSWPQGIAVLGVGWLAAVGGAGAMAFTLESTADPSRFVGWFALGCTAVAALVAVPVARRPPRRAGAGRPHPPAFVRHDPPVPPSPT